MGARKIIFMKLGGKLNLEESAQSPENRAFQGSITCALKWLCQYSLLHPPPFNSLTRPALMSASPVVPFPRLRSAALGINYPDLWSPGDWLAVLGEDAPSPEPKGPILPHRGILNPWKTNIYF